MANKQSAYQAALKDMKEANESTYFFEGKVKLNHYLNSLLGITSEPVKVAIEAKVEVKVKVNYMPPEVYKPVPRKVRVINPDGTIAIFGDDWDRK